MIAKLRGKVDSIGQDHVIIDVNGVGYLVFASAKTLATLPVPGEDVSLLIDTHVREDHIHLYGFTDEQQKSWFAMLQSVQGIGAKVALGVLSALTVDELYNAVLAGDEAPITRANGVGKKTAQRVVMDLKDKAAKGAPALSIGGGKAAAGATGGKPQQVALVEDAISALVNLGYKRVEAHGAVVRAANKMEDSTPTVDKLITGGLKELSL